MAVLGGSAGPPPGDRNHTKKLVPSGRIARAQLLLKRLLPTAETSRFRGLCDQAFNNANEYHLVRIMSGFTVIYFIYYLFLLLCVCVCVCVFVFGARSCFSMCFAGCRLAVHQSPRLLLGLLPMSAVRVRHQPSWQQATLPSTRFVRATHFFIRCFRYYE